MMERSMSRRKPTEQEIDDWHEQGRARQHWLAEHPEERAKEAAAHREKVQKRQRARVRKHQPVVVDISFNGAYAAVGFIRNNGERVIGQYKLTGWSWAPATEWRRLSGLPPAPPCDAAPESGSPPPDPAETLPN